MLNSFFHKDLTDAQWNRIKFVFENPAKVGRPSLNPRTVFNAIMWIFKSGARWRNLPARYGNWNSIYHKFRRRCSLGLFKRLLKIIKADTKDANLLEIDSTFCKVHQSACLALKNQAIELFSGVELGDKKILEDRAYGSEQIRFFLAEHELYKHRNIIKSFFQRIKNFRHIATRFDKLAVCFKNFFLLAACVIHF